MENTKIQKHIGKFRDEKIFEMATFISDGIVRLERYAAFRR